MVLQARETGRAGYIDASITDNMALLPSVLLADLVAGIPVSPRADQTFLAGALACYDVYRLVDGYAVVGGLCVPKTLSGPDFGFDGKNSLFLK